MAKSLVERGQEEELIFVVALVGSLCAVEAALETEKGRKIRRMSLIHIRLSERGAERSANREFRDIALPGLPVSW